MCFSLRVLSLMYSTLQPVYPNIVNIFGFILQFSSYLCQRPGKTPTNCMFCISIDMEGTKKIMCKGQYDSLTHVGTSPFNSAY